jgi:serine/threonine-protein kinase
MTFSKIPPEADLDTVLAEVLSTQGEGADQTIRSLIEQFPRFASEIEECWKIHQELRSSTDATRTFSNQPSFRGSRIGSQLGAYELLDELDRGGMGIVYRARHPQLERVVALKIIRSGELADEMEILRFRREAQAAARLVHPGIIPIYEVGQDGALLFYTMPLVEGKTLASYTTNQRLALREAVYIVHRLALAIDYAHDRGIIHRDLKPSNVLLDSNLNPIVIDFGLAKISQQEQELTGSGMVGTPSYMAPEQLRGASREQESACDIYSLGAILYFVVTGRPPFVGSTVFDILLQVKDREPLAPSTWNRSAGHEIDAICGRAMEKDPSQRYARSADLASDLQYWLDGTPIQLPALSWRMRWLQCWRKVPGLVSHVIAIAAVMGVVMLAHAFDVSNSNFLIKIGLLSSWLVLCFPLQRWTLQQGLNGWSGGCVWGIADVAFTTCLIANAEPPRALLLIAYPMMIAASGLFYRTQMVIGMTLLCVVGFLVLPWWTGDDSLARQDFQAIFVIGMGVLGLTLTSMIGRIRNVFSMRRI